MSQSWRFLAAVPLEPMFISRDGLRSLSTSRIKGGSSSEVLPDLEIKMSRYWLISLMRRAAVLAYTRFWSPWRVVPPPVVVVIWLETTVVPPPPPDDELPPPPPPPPPPPDEAGSEILKEMV